MTGNFSRLDRVTGLTDWRERDALGRLIDAARTRHSRPWRRGDPEVGMTVLLGYSAGRVLDVGGLVGRVTGAQAEMPEPWAAGNLASRCSGA